MKRFCIILVALALACLGVSACNKADTNQTPTPTPEEELEAALPKLFGNWNTATTDGVYYTVEIAREQIHLRKSDIIGGTVIGCASWSYDKNENMYLMRTTGDQSRRIIFTIIPGETWDTLTFFCLDDLGYVKIMGDYYCTDPYIRKHQ